MGSSANKLVVAMVGLPASGKSTVAAKLRQCLEAEGVTVGLFNNGDVRRSMCQGQDTSCASFYAPDNAEGAALRENFARVNMERAAAFLESGGEVAVLDATNVSEKRRRTILEKLGRWPVFFLECVNRDPELQAASIARKAQLPEFAHMDTKEAQDCFRERIRYYERIRAPLDGGVENFVVLNTLDNSIERERVQAVLPHYRLVRDLLVSDWVRNLYLARHGETFHNLENRIGGDSDLTAKGLVQAQSLAWHFRETPLPYVFTSTRKRTLQMAELLCRGREDCLVIPLPELDEIDAGVCENMTYAEIARDMPEVHEERTRDKYGYVYPRGEGYATLRERVERGVRKALYLSGNAENIMIVGHQAVNRTILSHFLYRRTEDVPHIYIPQDRYFHIVSTPSRKVFELVKFG
ncbi:Adenosylcobalamin/alpha-ribazole phosphatase [Fundidesulfovibrio magnetotacticus]|uniref:Adenosylcobalamin/alpha-ribazole phosphatase n=1 Tax=Fundidesulfovibrio magnetotacticus TaxID=2730080 RepID=A0A6V8LRH0_9BACT|nr:6-phosphofructo-2-kinase/fructose-2,6-bisphosphatase [Fundidesulfovibrio magnetotacticus]GFK93151.1 Adenosylcobalamin/alpha-ribazole phosphatase [Fundidesulfovibrio magnetotacticus]